MTASAPCPASTTGTRRRSSRLDGGRSSRLPTIPSTRPRIRRSPRRSPRSSPASSAPRDRRRRPGHTKLHGDAALRDRRRPAGRGQRRPRLGRSCTTASPSRPAPPWAARSPTTTSATTSKPAVRTPCTTSGRVDWRAPRRPTAAVSSVSVSCRGPRPSPCRSRRARSTRGRQKRSFPRHGIARRRPR